MSGYEHSTGGVVFRVVEKKPQFLLICDKNNNWTFPKGLIEGKDEIKSAQREIFEEAGLHNVRFISVLDTVRYFYRFKGDLIRKRVDYFLFQYEGTSTPKPQVEEGIHDVRWFDPKEALSIIGYAKSNKSILEKAIKKITNNN